MSRTAKAPLNDDQTLAALEQLEAEHGSMAEAIRHALIHAAAGTDDGDDKSRKVNAHLRPELRKAQRVVWDLAHDGAVNMDAALAVLAQKMQVDKDICRSMFIRPLAAEDMVRVDSGWSTTTLFVRDPDSTVDGDRDLTDETADPRHDIDDPAASDDRLDELADASGRAVATDGGRP